MINYIIYDNKNSSEWVTFVHGAGGSSSIWFKQIREFKKHFNILLLDLRGHGKSSNYRLKNVFEKKYTFSSISKDIIEILDKEKIKKSHFVGISLGTILIRKIAEIHPKMVKSMIMGGAIMKLNLRSVFLIKLSAYLGFQPSKDNISNPYFDLVKAKFVTVKNNSTLNTSLSNVFRCLIQNQPTKLNTEKKSEVLSCLIKYYKIHSHDITNLTSQKIIKSIMF